MIRAIISVDWDFCTAILVLPLRPNVELQNQGWLGIPSCYAHGVKPNCEIFDRDSSTLGSLVAYTLTNNIWKLKENLNSISTLRFHPARDQVSCTFPSHLLGYRPWLQWKRNIRTLVKPSIPREPFE